MHAALITLLVVGQAAAPVPPQVATEEGEPRFIHGALEASGLTLPSGPRGGDNDFFGVFSPILGISGGENFGMELGADLRLRVIDLAPAQRDGDPGGVLRAEDWD